MDNRSEKEQSIDLAYCALNVGRSGETLSHAHGQWRCSVRDERGREEESWQDANSDYKLRVLFLWRAPLLGRIHKAPGRKKQTVRGNDGRWVCVVLRRSPLTNGGKQENTFKFQLITINGVSGHCSLSYFVMRLLCFLRKEGECIRTKRQFLPMESRLKLIGSDPKKKQISQQNHVGCLNKPNWREIRRIR